eukprot:NODE_1052_length_1256_cov_260.372190.p1 GENE.NODE_1052_length_1256_cov_260.372190~~NODE_1052_length_1256_cov_260.372190.p1  ORF type:complete len:310 (+),score=66.58 NODE_1052_length_1256_cov_260.372190:3-932(+)
MGNPKGMTLQVIPGDEDLFIGGGGLNGSIAKTLREHGHPIAMTGESTFDKTACPFAELHKKVFNEARKARACRPINTLCHADLQDVMAKRLPLIYSGACVLNNGEETEGIAIIDIFHNDNRPFSMQNAGVLYTVSPLGQNQRADGVGGMHGRQGSESHSKLVVKDKEVYRRRLYETAANIATAVLQYNKHAKRKAGLPPIEVIRLPIIGSGNFKHPDVETVEMASLLIWGIHMAMTTLVPREILRFDLMGYAPFKAALEEYNQGQIAANPPFWYLPASLSAPFEAALRSQNPSPSSQKQICACGSCAVM